MGPPLLSYLVLKTKLPVVQFKAFSAVKKCGFEPKLFSIYYTFLFCFFVYIVSNVYGDGYLIWVIIKIKNNAQICSVVNEYVYFIISVAESDVKKKTLCGSSISYILLLPFWVQRQRSKKTSIVYLKWMTKVQILFRSDSLL